MAKPGALAAIRQAQGLNVNAFDADQRTKTREETPVVIGGVTFNRRRKVWIVSRAMRQMMREQESALAKSNRIRARVSELELEQLEAAAEGKSDVEGELEDKIRALIAQADEETEVAELVSYRLLALLLIPTGKRLDPSTGVEHELEGFGSPPAEEDPVAYAMPAVEFMQPELDVEDAAGLTEELTGSREPDPQGTPSSGSGSS